MLLGKTIGLVMLTYNCAKTLNEVYKAIPHNIVDEIISVDDYSNDNTISIENSSSKIIFASKMKDDNAQRNGMPLCKYISNKILTDFQNILLNKPLMTLALSTIQ